MTFARVATRALLGLSAPEVQVEVHLANGLPAFHLVGLPETAVKESRDRVRSALLMAGFEFPNRRITVNLSPADLPKEGGRYDLAIALGILVATGQLAETCLEGSVFIGELALNADLSPIRGVLPTALVVHQQQLALALPAANRDEASLVQGLPLYPASSLLDLVAQLERRQPQLCSPPTLAPVASSLYPDLSSVKGQLFAKRALEIAAAGQHNLLLNGPPGSGKTLLASCLPGLLPPLEESEALEVAAMASISQGFDVRRWRQRPYRAPHHSSSAAALVGGGSHPQPGEISLAHRGVLFLDELPEYDRKVLEVLREPLESGEIHLARARSRATYPAQFLLMSAMNPCPCGFLGHPHKACQCSPHQVQRYQSRVSGPLLDRIDLHVKVAAVPAEDLFARSAEENSQAVRERVCQARARQLARAGKLNGQLSAAELERDAILQPAEKTLLIEAMQRLQLSARSAHRLLKVARTLADLQQSEQIERQHLLEALSYRPASSGVA